MLAILMVCMGRTGTFSQSHQCLMFMAFHGIGTYTILPNDHGKIPVSSTLSSIHMKFCWLPSTIPLASCITVLHKQFVLKKKETCPGFPNVRWRFSECECSNSFGMVCLLQRFRQDVQIGKVVQFMDRSIGRCHGSINYSSGKFHF